MSYGLPTEICLVKLYVTLLSRCDRVFETNECFKVLIWTQTTMLTAIKLTNV
jgi:hypothetical protein